MLAWVSRSPVQASDVVFEVVHSFGGEDGAVPNGGLTVGPGGELYGITTSGGANSGGTAFKVATDGTFTVLHSFDPEIAYRPFAGVALGVDGNFYGVTQSRSPFVVFAGSLSGITIGTLPPPIPIPAKVYRLTPQGQFAVVSELDFEPHGRLTAGRDGSVYGATDYGNHFKGGLYRVTPAGAVTMLHSFSGTDGSQPDPGTINGTGTNTFGAGLLEGSTGVFYGLTRSSATRGLGTLFRYSLQSGLTTLHTFSADEGLYPGGGLLLAADGTIFGTTNEGGPTHVGTVFKFSQGELTTLHAFSPTDGNGWYPESLTLAGDGYFYGTNSLGGPSGTFLGSIFKMSPAGELTTIHAFTAEGGAKANGGLVNGADGNLYGMTAAGGEFGSGTIFRIRLGALNRAPVARDDQAPFGLPGGGAPADGRIVIDVLANDFDLDSQDQVQLLHVSVPAHGTATIVPLSASASAGNPNALAIEYRPEPGFSGDDEFTYSISDGKGATASAKVIVHVPNDAVIPIFLAGRFHARFESQDHRMPGYLRIALTATGAFTGELRVGPEAAIVRGSFSPARTAMVDLVFPKSGAAKLQLALAGNSTSIGGSIEFAGRSIDFTASRIPAVSNGSDSPRPKHRYTALLLSPAASGATGYLVIAIRNGEAVLLGQTADGQPFSSRGSVAADGTLHVFSHAQKTGPRADLVGEISFGSEADSATCQGELLWRPLPGEAGPELRLEVLGAAYAAPAPGQRPMAMPKAVVRFGFAKPMTQIVNVLPSGELIPEGRGGDSPTLRINPISGAFRGIVTDPATGLRHLARGAILQQPRRGAGFAGEVNVTVEPL